MKFNVLNQSIIHHSSDCLIIPAFSANNDPKKPARQFQLLDQTLQGLLTRALESEDFSAKLGESWLIREANGLQAQRLLVIGAGNINELTTEKVHQFYRNAMHAVDKLNVKEVAIAITDLVSNEIPLTNQAQILACQAIFASYRFEQFKSKPRAQSQLEQLTLLIDEESHDQTSLNRQLTLGAAFGQGINYCRYLGDLPANICTPNYLSEQAQQLMQDEKTQVEILDEHQLAELGANAILAVGRGSRQAPRLIVMHYQNNPNSKPHVLVGKGITFDSGGISLKPSADMDEMKYDMGGAASIFGVFKALQILKPKLNVIGIIASAENMPDGNAVKPGDIIKTLKGLSVEILNTDAEGRLVLCDALTYAERFQPISVIDIATLTGACIIALGDHASGLFANNDKLSQALQQAGQQSADRAWPLPLWSEYQEQLKSEFADLANVGGRKAGAVTAACFLSRFTEQFAWAHLDVAGTAWQGKKGATGRPVSLLLQYLLSQQAE